MLFGVIWYGTKIEFRNLYGVKESYKLIPYKTTNSNYLLIRRVTSTSVRRVGVSFVVLLIKNVKMHEGLVKNNIK